MASSSQQTPLTTKPTKSIQPDTSNLAEIPALMELPLKKPPIAPNMIRGGTKKHHTQRANTFPNVNQGQNYRMNNPRHYPQYNQDNYNRNNYQQGYKNYNNRSNAPRGEGQSYQRNCVPPGNRNQGKHNKQTGTTVRNIGFRFLEEISKLNSLEALVRMKNSNEALQNILQSQLEPDLIALLLKILANICESDFDESKSRILIEISNSNFIPNLQMYVMNLIYTSEEDKKRNRFFWSDPNSFWNNLLVFCESIILISPSTALSKLRALVEGAIGVTLDGLKDQHNLTLLEDINQRLTEIKKQFVIEQEVEEEKKKDPNLLFNEDESQPPPNNFRELSVLPSADDLLGEMPYVRPNIVNGGYANVDHYLDVQFRLLREDCYGPLREGIRQFVKDGKRRRYDNIRVHKDALLLEPYHSKDKIGILVQFDKIDYANRKQNKRQRVINWAHSKRFMFGSLLLLTKDNQSFIIATVIDRDVETLERGLLPVSLFGIESHPAMNLFGQSFTMIESEVYFEPYYHVLKALQDPSFAQHLAMSNYIVDVQPETNPPKYLSEDSEFSVQIHKEGQRTEDHITVLNEETWPQPQELGLDQTQYDAYKMALTHEFAVIQGPPGTGKTYLAILVARTLLTNLEMKGCSLLVICYTNHALDQFLEAILKITDSVVRIGAQSKSEKLQKHNLSKMRSFKSREDRNSHVNKFYLDRRYTVQKHTNDNKNLQNSLNVINNGLVSAAVLQKFNKDVDVLLNHYKRKEDPIILWLFEDVEQYYGQGMNTENMNDNDYKEDIPEFPQNDNPRNIILDDLDEFDCDVEMDVKNIFDTRCIKNNLRKWRGLARNSQTQQDEYAHICRINLWQTRLNCFEDQKFNRWSKAEVKIKNKPHPNEFNLRQRWSIYHGWCYAMKNKIIAQLATLQIKHKEASDEYEEARMMMDRNLLENTQVVGMTTTGAARLQKLIRSLKTPIVIVEEAAEVLESHIVVSLTSHCRHLILIGDHQQLRPSASHYKLAKHYNMEISLFERMITNGIHSRRLGVQHRMRPGIASLIVPAIYPELENHASVENYPNVRGMTANLFFLTHSNYEDPMDDSNSRQNRFEGDMTLALANYIMQQGYGAEDVTILAAYSGQMFYMRKKRDTFSHLRNVKITVVDNYQGEESKIILLSLVRNNAEGNIGFLGTANRVCVALSRAKEGFYIMGNMDILKNATDLWKTISESLEVQQALGTSITLRCENHPDQITEVKEVADFINVPEGGCMQKCDINMPCGHPCPLLCHVYDRGHANTKCLQKCTRVLCDLGHVCPLDCAKKCQPCMTKVPKTLPCGHEHAIPCHMELENANCITSVEATLPACGHKAMKACYVDVMKAPCPEPCVYRLPCGHSCVKHCHKNYDPDHLKYNCEKPCPKKKKGCTAVLEEGELGPHECKKKCYEDCDVCNVEVTKKRSDCAHRETVKCCVDVNSLPCRQKCKRALPCGHHCANKCHEPCGNCMQMMKKNIESCGHRLDVLCKDEPKASDCRHKCERTLSCGHKCTLRCNEPCAKSVCMEISQKTFKSPCGHAVNLPCHYYNKGLVGEEVLLQHCKAACKETLSCGHSCSGTCGECRQGRLHAPCTQPCRRPMLCGHECEEPCNDVCPPCKKQCEVRCVHNRCNLLCGQPCKPCKEKCARSCIHGKCTRNCGERCSRGACNEACPLEQPCGHRCRGLCGEPCPDICNVCDPDNFPKDLTGDDFGDDAKLIKLQDCKAVKGHFMEVENMDNLMKGDKETIMIRSCPYCRALIINTQRYKDLVNATFRDEINPIKMKVFGHKKEIVNIRLQVHDRTKMMLKKYCLTGQDNWMWEAVLAKIQRFISNKSLKIPLPELKMHLISLDILDMLAKLYQEHLDGNLRELRTELTEQIEMICKVLAANTRKISSQQQRDIGEEIKRTRAILQLSKITSNQAFILGKADPEVQAASEEAMGHVLTWEVFREDKARHALKILQETVKLSGIVVKPERDLVVQAIGLKSGHWFKCPNGHFYCIGECGGAMQTSKCIECGAAVGGSNHRLLSDNQHAREIDGSKFAAWSETANNMANFQIIN